MVVSVYFHKIVFKCNEKWSIKLIVQSQDYNLCALRPTLPVLLTTTMIGTAMWRTKLCAFSNWRDGSTGGRG